MDLGPLGGYRLPSALQTAYGVTTAQELADQLGVTKAPTAELGGEADAAYQSLRQGDPGPARSLLVDKLGVSEQNADEALAKLPPLT
ncbi:hypothetical protein NVV95_13160 [Herbiconiux sp. CPCC 205716]|uniref:Uncharacterized protein n=1 Tax=Herbiconiux gentiana TaxID=2970912 RepID=A0ABT2GH42_9MICO|nr:hypothetical protein [Herbiconiux gentiana]MCS5715493.1 hypothetical protein [Herbiconiux gentiana]